VSYLILYPVNQVIDWYTYSERTLPTYLRSRTELLTEIETLEQELANRAGTQTTIQRLINENMQLRAVAELGTTSSRIAARVIAQPTKLSYDLMKIDQGSLAGVELGAPVFVGVDTVVGVVVHVTPTYAFVDLVTTPGFSATAYVVGPNIFTPLEGVGGGVARVRVPQGVPLEVGNIVLLPSVDSGVYGEIVAVENVPSQPEQFGYVAPPVSLQSMLYVSVGRGRGEERPEVEIEESVRMAVRQYFRLASTTQITTATTSSATSSTSSLTVTESQ
jgi:cell shape-determining protein MreC